MASNFASGNVDRLNLPDGQWIEVKRDTSVGDMKRIRKMTHADDDPMLFRLAYLYVRLAGWSLTDEAGKPVELSEDAFDALTSARLKDIGDAIDQYVEKESAEKNAPTATSETPSETNSPSVA